jgi:hypothetical protein
MDGDGLLTSWRNYSAGMLHHSCCLVPMMVTGALLRLVAHSLMLLVPVMAALDLHAWGTS